MPSPFNAAQLQVLEEEYAFGRLRAERSGRMSKNIVTMAIIKCDKVGPRVSGMEVGRYFANRTAADAGRPRAVRKTPEQLERLRESFEEDPYPTVGESIVLVHSTGLEPKQVKQWFENERKKAFPKGERIFTRNESPDRNDAARMWRAYKKDPEGYVRALCSGEISAVTGERQKGEDDEDEDDIGVEN